MDKRPAALHWVYFLFAVILFACSGNQEPEIFEQHLKDYPGINKKYIYQSVLRLANTKQDPDFDKLIRDVRKITIYFPPEDTTYQVKTLRTSMRSGGYEELMDFRTAKGERLSLWLNEALDKPHYVGFVEISGDYYIFDIDGQLDLNYLSALNMADESSLRDLFK